MDKIVPSLSKNKKTIPQIKVDLNIAKNFDLHPFLWGKCGIDIIDTILRSKNLAKEFRDEIYKKFIEAIYNKCNQISSEGYVVTKSDIDTELSNCYKGKLTFVKSDLRKRLDNPNMNDNAKKDFDKLSSEEKSQHTKIQVKYMEYTHPIDGLDAVIAKMTQRNINNENLSLTRLLQNILNINRKSSEYGLQEALSTSTMKSLFEHYASNIIETINHPGVIDKSSLNSPKNFCKLYEHFKYQGNTTIDKALKSIFEFNPIMVMECLLDSQNFSLLSELSAIILESPLLYSNKIQIAALKACCISLVGQGMYERCLQKIKEYLPQKKFHDVLKNTVTALKVATNYIENKKLLAEVLERLDIYESTEVHSPDISLHIMKDDLLITVSEQHPVKEMIISSIIDKNINLFKYFAAELSKMYSEAVALNFVLDRLYISSDSSFIFKIYQALNITYQSDQFSLEKIKASKKLYEVKLASKKYMQSLSKTNLVDKIEISVEEKEGSADEINLSALAKEAETYIKDAEATEIKAVKVVVKEEDPQVLIHKAFQLQKKIASEKVKQDMHDRESQSWVVNSIKITYNEDIAKDSNEQYNIKKVNTSFGSILYVAIEPDLIYKLDPINCKKFTSASDHWAGAFYNKSGIKLLTKANDEKIGYEIKIIGEDSRLVTQNLYKNPEGQDLLIFDQKLDHQDISRLTNSFSIQNVESDILGSNEESIYE